MSEVILTRYTPTDRADAEKEFNRLPLKKRAALLMPIGFVGNGVGGLSFSQDALNFMAGEEFAGLQFVGDLPGYFNKLGTFQSEAKEIWRQMTVSSPSGKQLSIERDVPGWVYAEPPNDLRSWAVRASQAVARDGADGLKSRENAEQNPLDKTIPVFQREFFVATLGEAFFALPSDVQAVLTTPIGYFGNGFDVLPKIKNPAELYDRGIQFLVDALLNEKIRQRPDLQAVITRIGIEAKLEQTIPGWQFDRQISGLTLLPVPKEGQDAESYRAQRFALVVVAYNLGLLKKSPVQAAAPKGRRDYLRFENPGSGALSL